MKRTSVTSRLLAFAMAVAICFSLVPWTVFAAETGTYIQVTSAEEFTSGQYVLVTDKGYAPGVYDNGTSPWITALQPTVEAGVITDTAGAVWTLTVDGTSVKLTDANGVTVAPKGGNNNGIKSGDYSWAWSFENGKFTFAGTGSDTVVLASNVGSSNKFRAYKTTTISGNPAGYPCAFTAYKLVEPTVEPEPSEPEETTAPSEPEETTVPSEPAVTVSTVAEARAMASGTEDITVEATVIRVSGKNVVVQDATAGINLYFNTAPTDIAVGDVIRATGKRGAFNGLEQLTGVETFEKIGAAELPLKEVTIAEILADQDAAALESTRVLIKGAVLGATSGKNTALTQGESTINIYGMPTLEGIVEGDTVDVIAIVGDYKGYQLNVNAASDVTKVVIDNTPAWNDVDAKYDVYQLVSTLTSGDTVVIYNPGNAKALSSEDAGYYKAGVDAAVVGETYIASNSDFIAWNVSVENGVCTFTQGDLKLGVEKSESNGKTYFNLKTNAGDYGFTVEAFQEGSELFKISSSTLTGQYGSVYLEWYASKNAFSAYCTGEDRLTEKDFGFRFYKLVREGVVEEEPETPTEPSQPTEPVEPEEPVGNIATLVADAASLKAGDQILIVASGSNFALGTTQNKNNRAQAEVTKSEDSITVTYGDDAQIITLEAGLTEGTWAFNVGGYLYAAGQSKAQGASSNNNHLKVEQTLTANSSWTVEIADGIATVKATGENGCNWMRHNATSKIFSCYTSGQKDISIYRLAGTEDEPQEPEVPEVTGVTDGEYVIWAPAYNMALSSNYSGFYNSGVAVTLEGDKLTGYGATEIWTVKNNEDGTLTISCESGKLSMDTEFSSMPLNKVNDTWTLEDAGNGLWYVKNVGRETYIEWYADKNNWSSYYKISAGSEGMFALKFTPAVTEEEPEVTGVADGEYVIWAPAYNMALSSNYSGFYNSGVAVTLEGDKLTGYGATEIWTVKNNEDGTLTISCESGKLSMDTEYSSMPLNKVNDTWTLEDAGNGLWYVKNVGRETYIEWYADKNNWSGYYKISAGSEGMFALKFTPAVTEEEPEVPEATGVADGEYVVWAPAYNMALSSNYSGFYNSGVAVTLEGDKLTGYGATEVWTVKNNEDGTITISCESGKLSMDTEYSSMPLNKVNDTWTLEDAGNGLWYVKNVGRETYIEWYADKNNWSSYYKISEGKEGLFALKFTPAELSDEPSEEPSVVEIVKFTPNGGAMYIEGDSAEIVLSTATEGATIYYATSADGETFTEFAEYTAPILVSKGFGKLTIRAYAEKEGSTSVEAKRTFTERSAKGWQLYFGQLHSHTSISDGAGTIEEAFNHASRVENLDFLAVTDHSNSFDGEGSGVLAEDGALVSSEWKQAQEAAEAITVPGEFVGLYGFEMTWSGGSPGHMNTFNTPGWQSRTQEAYKDKSMTALQNYYNALATVPESISQFNHPGTMFGDFFDFGCYSESADSLITLIEVGNGEGAIGSSGYFPSYEYYTRALDKGWHVAPSNNQDNHKGMWGDANTGRTVILADFLDEEAIYDALRNYRVYATEDNDLEIYYSLNGYTMGTILDESAVEENVTISVRVFDPTEALGGKLEVIVNGGFSAASHNLAGSTGTVELTVPAEYNYYYIKITQADGDIAVTAPVWVGEIEAVGISSLEVEADLCIEGDEQTITARMFNNESKDMVVDSLVYTNKQSGEILYTDTALTAIPKEGTASSSFKYTFAKDGVYTITATLKGTLNGVEKTYTKDLEITVMPASITSRIIVDGTHYNDYVSGYYAGNMGNMTAIAGSQGIDVHVEMEKITPEMLDSCSLLVISAPAGYTGEHNGTKFNLSPFEDDFIAMVADYVRNGGNVVVCGIADYQDRKATIDDYHKAAQLNKLLAAMGSSMRIHDDEAYDEDNNGGQAYRLYPNTFNMDSKWCEGIVEGQEYSQYSGCTVDPGNGTWLVKGHDTTYSIDSDNDGKGGVAKGEAVFMAAEETGFGGTVFVAGGVFLSDFEVKAEMDNIWDLPYANRTIYENIIGITRQQPAITPIADVRDSAEAELGSIFVIEGYVTAGTANPDTTFFDAIYVQDETGGITVFPYSEPGLELGTKVRITGFTDAYQGDIEIQVMSLEILDAPKNVIAPEKVSAKDAMNYAEKGGQLLQVEGEVVEVILGTGSARAAGQSVSQFVVKDANGDLAKVFIDGYILSGTTGANTLADIVKVGNTVSAVGLLYMHPEGDSETSVAVLRVRDCDEVVLIQEKEEEEVPTDPTDPTEPSEPETDKSELEKAVKTAKSKKQANYTKKSFNAMKSALKKAEKVLADENATQAEIDAATVALNNAIKALKPTTGKNPATSDSAYIELSLLVMTVSLLAMVVLVFNRKRFTV